MADQHYWRRSQRPWVTFRLRVTNLPYNYAEFAPHSAQRLRDMVWANHHIATHSIITNYKWHSSDLRHAFGSWKPRTRPMGKDLSTTYNVP